MEESDPPVESMEVEESFPLMGDVDDKMSSSSSDSSPSSEAEVSENWLSWQLEFFSSPGPFIMYLSPLCSNGTVA